MEKVKISIEYCTKWNYTPRAVSLADELLSRYTPSIASLTLLPSSGGRFEVTVNDTLVFSKLAVDRHAEPGEVASLVDEKLNADAKA